jgi:hypothetical protein
MKEKDLSKLVREYLQLNENLGRIYFVRNNSFAGKLTYKNGTSSYIKNNKKGTPDFLVLMKGGHFVGLELKGDKGKLDEDQEITKNQIKMLGGTFVEVRDLKDIAFLGIK